MSIEPSLDATHSGTGRLRSADRRAKIVVAAREVFCAKGLRGARMREIAVRAGVTESLLYRHFSSRETLYEVAVVDHLRTLLDDAVSEGHHVASEEGLDRADRIKRLASLYVRAMQEVVPLASVALNEDHSRGKLLYQEMVRPRLREVAAPLFKAATGSDPANLDSVVAMALLGVPYGVGLDAMLRGQPTREIDDISDRIAKLFLARS